MAAPVLSTDRIDLLRARGHIQYLHGKEYIKHEGLIEMAHEAGISSLITELVSWDPQTRGAVVYTTATGTRGTFTGIGDACPENVGVNIAGATLRMAETRSMNRALRCYLGIGMCTYDELPIGAPEASQGQQSRQVQNKPRVVSSTSQHACPDCGSGLWDNSEDRDAGRTNRPAYSCKGKSRAEPGCGWLSWESKEAPWNLPEPAPPSSYDQYQNTGARGGRRGSPTPGFEGQVVRQAPGSTPKAQTPETDEDIPF